MPIQGKKFRPITCRSSALIFSFCSISQVVRRCKQKTHAAKTYCHNKRTMLLAKYMHFFNPVQANVPFLYPLKTYNFRGYRKGTLVENVLSYKISNILLMLHTLSTEPFAKKLFHHRPDTSAKCQSPK